LVSPARLTKRDDEPRGSNHATAWIFADEKTWEKKLIAITWARSLAVLSLFSVGTAIAQNNSLAAMK
jgi:hypothetical protein